MKITIIAWVVVLALVAAGVYLYTQSGVSTDTPADVTYQTYTSAEYGISFQYPDTYVFEEHDTNSGERRHHTIVLMDKEDAANIPEGGEGPTAITIDIFQNNLDRMTIDDFIKGTNDSNYKLSPDGVLTPTAVDGSLAVAYMWDGLYRGNSIVFEHKQNIIMLSVTMFTPDDQIVADFAGVVAGMQLQ